MKNLKFDINKIRNFFPILNELVHGKKLVYLDNAATTQKPKIVVEALENFYFHSNSNIHRAVHSLAEKATRAYEETREKVSRFVGANYSSEIIFVKNATEAINLVAKCYGQKNFNKDDEIIISTMEHHSNIVPWQMISETTGAKLRVIKITPSGELDLNHYKSLLNPRTKFVAVTHASNALGTINPIEEIIALAHANKSLVLIDGAQGISHIPVNVNSLDCDFYVFSSHKMYGPTGVGILYGKSKLLNAMPPFLGGGDMIEKVTFEKTTYAALPQKFEAGTQNFADVVGFGATIDFINSIGLHNIAKHENELLLYATQKLLNIKGLQIIGTAPNKIGNISFVMEHIHPHDMATILDTEGIAVRAGHHCAMPLMDYYKLPGTTRASFAVYNTFEEVDILVAGILKAQKIFARK